MPVPSVASPSAPSISAETAQEPSPSVNATSSSVARRRPRPGARNEIASIRLVLPAPFGPTSTIEPCAGLERRGVIVAEIGQRQAADTGAVMTCHHPRRRTIQYAMRWSNNRSRPSVLDAPLRGA